jgi:AcrR family transcriptional regulator
MTEGERDRVRRLPPGPHGLPPELVERNQRERLIAAMAEVCGERGYAESSVAEVAKRAGVSTASFYRQFKDKRECMLVSFEELFGRLLEEIGRACGAEADPVEKAREGISVAAGLLAADPPAARLLSIEIVAVGPAGVRAQHEAIERMAALLRASSGVTAAAPAGTNSDAAWATVVAMVALVGRRIAEGRSPSAAELEALAEVR